jgi:hypothetical protein
VQAKAYQIICLLRCEKLNKYIKKINKKISQLIINITDSYLLKHCNVSIQDIIIPACNYLLNQLIESIQHSIQLSEQSLLPLSSDQEKIFNLKDQTIHLWLERRKNQRELFLLAYKELNELIHQQKDKKLWLKYTKDLSSVPANQNPTQVLDAKFYDIPAISDVDHMLAEFEYQELECTEQKAKIIELVHENESVCSVPLVGLEKILNNIKNHLAPFNTYDDRVTRWHAHLLGKALPENLFPEYQHLSLKQQIFQHACHFLFDFSFDALIQDIGINVSQEDTRKTLAIPAILSVPGFEPEKGVIGYGYDKEGCCYHRYFKKIRAEEILEKYTNYSLNLHDLQEADDIILEKVIENDFPSLQQAQSQLNQPSEKPILFKDYEIQYNSLFNTIEITHQINRLSVKLINLSLEFFNPVG